ncbi:Cleavage/polyadenylation specificity factor subunit A, partial [Nannochloropsis gaditana]
AAFAEEGRLLVGFGYPSPSSPPPSFPASPCVRLYDLGKRRLLKRADSGCLSGKGGREGGRPGGGITRLLHQGSWIYAVDCLTGVHALYYLPGENTFTLVADMEASPRLVTDALLLDTRTVAGADRQGNIFVARTPWEAVMSVEGVGLGNEQKGGREEGIGPTGGRAFWEVCGEGGEAPSRLESLVEYHVGETVSAMVPARLGRKGEGARMGLLYATIEGTLGILSPLYSPREKEVLLKVEGALLKLCAGGEGKEEVDRGLFVTARDLVTFRSAIRPAKGVIDLDVIVAAGAERRAWAAKKAKLSAEEVEEVLNETLAGMTLMRG